MTVALAVAVKLAMSIMSAHGRRLVALPPPHCPRWTRLILQRQCWKRMFKRDWFL
jgi:hypothetical protein